MLTFSADTLTTLTTTIFRAAGAPDDIASLMGRVLVGSNLAGHDSHGVIHISGYIDRIKAGDIIPDARPEILRETDSLVIVDGAWSFGHYASHVCMELAAAKAKQTGLAFVALTRANHIGRLGQWAEEAAAANVIGMITTSWSGGPFAATPYGGVGRVLSTNPIAFGMPLADGTPFVLDFATTAVAEGKLRVARDKRVSLPEGWIVDKEGRPSTDPGDFYAGGMLLPFFGHKGYALSLAVELLSVALTGADAVADDQGRKNGATFLAIDPAAVRPSLGDFQASAAAILERVTGVPVAPGSAGILIPGQPEAINRTERLRDGIPVAEATWAAIVTAAESVGVSTGDAVGT